MERIWKEVEIFSNWFIDAMNGNSGIIACVYIWILVIASVLDILNRIF